MTTRKGGSVMYPILMGAAYFYAVWAELLRPQADAEVVVFIPRPHRHVHVGESQGVVKLRRFGA
jgi:hypothetical protein